MALMVRCLLTGLPCGKPITIQDKTFFLAEPEELQKDRERRAKAINEAIGKKFKIRSALKEKQPIAFNCKICEMIQCCAYGMADITGQNPNVILELGMMFAIGKPVIILCKRGQEKRLKLPSDLNAIEMILFEDYIDIIGDLRDITASLPTPIRPPRPVEETEQMLREVNPRLAEEIKKTLDDHRRELAAEFEEVIKAARLETIIPQVDKVEISAELEQRLNKLEESLMGLGKLGFTTDAKTAFYRGNFYHERQQYEAALAQYDLCLTLKPDFPEALYNRGNTYHRMERYEEALADFNQALKLEPDAPDALYNRGLTYAKMERYEEALADLNQALKIKPDYPEALNGLGTTYIKMERYDEALSAFNRALKLKPDYPPAVYNIACLFSLRGKSDDAISYLEKAIALDDKLRKYAATDPDRDFDNIRDNPRFKKLIEGE